jgi:MoaA/NifB/PqqE/SkfB family radical SAM enzyme
MKKSDLFTILLPYLASYKFKRWFGYKNFNPMTVTYSVTAACQSRCKTCQIGAMFCQDPTRSERDLKLNEVEKIFSTMHPVYFFNMSGGEPFMRKDLPEIVRLACKYLKPKVVHTPTNAILTDRIIENTEKIIRIVRNYNPSVPVTVKPSIDGVGDLHDEIRGVKGNFDCLLKTIDGLKRLEDKYDNFHLELGTVISNFNIDYLDEIEDFVHSLGVESYRNEVAECRTEFFNLDDPITPPAEVYQKLIKEFARKVEDNISTKKSLAKTTEALRVVYYDIAGKILEEKKQVIPCYAGVSNVHINYDGGVWPCCVLGYDQQMGNLRDYNYDFQKLWHSNRADEVRRYIKEKNCACPLANQAYSNELMHFPTLLKAGIKTIYFNLK